MEELNLFLTILAWIVGVPSLILLLYRAHTKGSYTLLLRDIDVLRGINRTFPMMWSAILSAFSWAWIITGWCI